jgi:hypothetical protein
MNVIISIADNNKKIKIEDCHIRENNIFVLISIGNIKSYISDLSISITKKYEINSIINLFDNKSYKTTLIDKRNQSFTITNKELEDENHLITMKKNIIEISGRTCYESSIKLTDKEMKSLSNVLNRILME